MAYQLSQSMLRLIEKALNEFTAAERTLVIDTLTDPPEVIGITESAFDEDDLVYTTDENEHMIREKVLNLFNSTPGARWFYDDIGARLNLSLRDVVTACEVLEAEGLIGEAGPDDDRKTKAGTGK